MALTITLKEALTFYVGKAAEFGMSGVPDAERLTLILKRMADDVSTKKTAYQQALSAVVAIQDPGDSSQGSLAVLRRKLEKYNAQGASWGSEYKSSQDNRRKDELMHLMNLASPQIASLKGEIANQETLLATTTETLQLRRTAYETAEAEYHTLAQQGSALVAQTNALKQAQAERQRAMQQTGGKATTDSGAILAQLHVQLDQAHANDRAAQLIATDEHHEKSLDEIIAEQEKHASQDALVNQWIQ